jgi:GT2 family glycosyltransferase
MTHEAIEAKPLLAVDEIEISRLRPVYQSESLAKSLANLKSGNTQKKKNLGKLVVAKVLEFAPRGSRRRDSLKRFWRFVPNSFKTTIFDTIGWVASSQVHLGISTSFNLDRGFGLRTSKEPIVSIVIPVHNKYHFTLQCLRALQLNTDTTPYEVIVINDASSDWTKTALSNIRGIRVFNIEENVGYLRATNLGIAAARGKYTALLNNDTIPISGWLDRLVNELESDPQIGIVGAKLLYPDMQVQEMGSQIFNDGTCWNLGKNTDYFLPEHSFTREVDYVSASAILVRSDLLARTEGFDELYIPAYYEDADLAMQARKLGLRVVAVHDSFVIHIEGGSHGTNTSGGIKQYQVLNKEKFTAKWSTELVSHWDPIEGPRLESKRESKGIVIIYDAQIPQGLRDAGSQRATQIAKNLSDLGFHVIYFAPDDSVSITDVLRFRDMGIEIQTNHGALESSLENRSNRVRGIWMQRISVANSFFDSARRKFPTAPIIFDTVDLVSNRIRREKREGIQAEMTLNEAVRLEKKFINHATLTLAVSSEEKSQMQSQVPLASIETLWMSFETVKEVEKKDYLSNVGLFVGNFRHTPNKVSLNWFAKEVLPLILERNADFVLNVIGTGLTPSEVFAISSEGLNYLGFVDDLTPEYENAKVVVVPLQYGAGIKGKTCEALSHSTAIVSTSYGVEGLDLRNGVEYLLADDAVTFALQVSKVLNDKKLREALSSEGLNYANKHLSAEAFSRKMEKIAQLFE